MCLARLRQVSLHFLLLHNHTQESLLQFARTIDSSLINKNKRFKYKGENGITTRKCTSLPFLRCYEEKEKSGGSHHIAISLPYFSPFQTRENHHLFSISLFSISLFLVSLQTNRVLMRVVSELDLIFKFFD
jgi:hypothetical protein